MPHTITFGSSFTPPAVTRACGSRREVVELSHFDLNAMRARARAHLREPSIRSDGIIQNNGPNAANKSTPMISQVNDMLR